jgi:hypothetical protein
MLQTGFETWEVGFPVLCISHYGYLWLEKHMLSYYKTVLHMPVTEMEYDGLYSSMFTVYTECEGRTKIA